jgi:hypothetical protein
VTHFVLAGAALFLLDAWRGHTPPRSGSPRTIVISAGRVTKLREEFTRSIGRPPTAADESALVQRAIDEEVLYREARAMGLDREDASIQWVLAEQMGFLGNGDEAAAQRPTLYQAALNVGLDRDDAIVRRMLIEKMRLLIKHAASSAPAAEAELQDYVEGHADEFRQPATVTFWHVFLSADVHGTGLERDARARLAALTAAGHPGDRFASHGDSFPLAPHVRAQSVRELMPAFGRPFAEAVMNLEPGSWEGPIASPSGLHLVWIERQDPAYMPPLEVIRGRALLGLRAERLQRDVADVVTRLRARYDIRVDAPSGDDT